MEEMKILTLNGVSYEITDAKAREDIGSIDTALDAILAIQQELMGGETA